MTPAVPERQLATEALYSRASLLRTPAVALALAVATMAAATTSRPSLREGIFTTCVKIPTATQGSSVFTRLHAIGWVEQEAHNRDAVIADSNEEMNKGCSTVDLRI